MALTLYVDSYCAEADVERLMKQRNIGASTVFTSTDLETVVKRRFQQINSRLAKAGYVVPVTQGIATLTAGATLQANAAYSIDANVVTLKDSGGSLTGKVVRGDTVVFNSHSQVYVVGDMEIFTGSNLITFTIIPGLVAAVAESEAVTHTSIANAKDTLLNLNALGAAVDAIRSMAQGANADPPASYTMLRDEYNEILEALGDGTTPLLGIAKHEDVAPPGTVRIGRRA